MNFRNLGAQFLEKEIGRAWSEVPEQALQILEQRKNKVTTVPQKRVGTPEDAQGLDGKDDGRVTVGCGEIAVTQRVDAEQAQFAEGGQVARPISVSVDGSYDTNYWRWQWFGVVYEVKGPGLEGEHVQFGQLGHGKGLVADIGIGEDGQGKFAQGGAAAFQCCAQAGHDMVAHAVEVQKDDILEVKHLEHDSVQR